jgi:hypothetical protein
MADDPWDRFPDAPATPQQGRAPNIFDPFDTPQPLAQPQARTLPPGSDGGYSIERDPDGKEIIAIHIGGRKLLPHRPQVGAGEYGLPYMPPLSEQPPQAELRNYDPTLEDRARSALTDVGMPAGQAQRAAAVVPYTPPAAGYQGGRIISEGIHEGSPAEIAGGVAMTGLAAAPGPATRLVAGGVGRAADLINRTIAAAPRTAMGTLAAGGMIASAGEAGDDPRAEAVASQATADKTAMADAAKQLETALEQRKSLDQQRSIATAERDAELRGQAGKTAGRGKNYQAKEAEISRLSSEMERLDATISDLRRRSSPEYAAYVAKVREVEQARQDILDKSRKPFEEAHPDWAARQWTIPAVLGGITAMALRFKGGGPISERLQGGRWWDAVKLAGDATQSPAARTQARLLAEELEAAMPAKTWKAIAGSYAAPAALGTVEGAFASNTPEFYNLFLPPENPERKAYEEYIKRLPDGHPEIARTAELLKSIPADNPARRAAQEHFLQLKPALLRSIEGAGEGAVAGMFVNTGVKALAPAESGLPRPETRALLEGAARRAASRAPSPTPLGPGSGPSPALPALPSPGAGRLNGSPSPAAIAPRSAPESTTPDSKSFNETPWGKRDKKTGRFSDKTSGLFDRIALWGGYG